MQIAIIDLGTNTFNLLIAEVTKDNSFSIVLETKYPAKLGKGGINKKTITPEAVERGFTALETHLETIKGYDVKEIHCFATSAIRSADNGKEFVAQVKERYGLDINVIQGEAEAELIYDGVKQVVPIGEKNVLIMDIGGGSTEFILANKNGVLWKHSFDIGAARMLDFVQPSEPILPNEIDKLTRYISSELVMLFDVIKDYEVDTLIGSSGSFDTIAAMIAVDEHPHLDMAKITSYHIDQDLFDKLLARFVKSTLEERLKMKRMEAHRVEMMVLASLFIKFIIEKLNIKFVFQCAYALKEGAIYQILNKKK